MVETSGVWEAVVVYVVMDPGTQWIGERETGMKEYGDREVYRLHIC